MSNHDTEDEEDEDEKSSIRDTLETTKSVLKIALMVEKLLSVL
jgi:hypothetical protein